MTNEESGLVDVFSQSIAVFGSLNRWYLGDFFNHPIGRFREPGNGKLTQG